MSVVQIAYQTILTKLRDWPKLNQNDKLQILQQACSLMGQSFRVALYILEQNPNRLSIEDHQMFFTLTLDKQKFVLFKSHSQVKLNDCTCKNSWMRKTGLNAPYMCVHQILIQLVQSVFHGKVRIQKFQNQGIGQLSELLQIV